MAVALAVDGAAVVAGPLAVDADDLAGAACRGLAAARGPGNSSELVVTRARNDFTRERRHI
jgi:hypothetical protein